MKPPSLRKRRNFRLRTKKRLLAVVQLTARIRRVKLEQIMDERRVYGTPRKENGRGRKKA